jgi:hypothetical protein
MNREALLAGGIALLVLLSALVLAAVPGAVASHEDDGRPGALRIQEMTVATGSVTGENATLAADTRLQHRGGNSENVTVELRAVSLETGMVEATSTSEVGTVAGNREEAVEDELTVPREGGYRLEAVLYADGRRLDAGHKTVRGVGALEPPYARSDVGFHRYRATDIPTVEFSVADVEGDRVRLNVSAALTNTGDDPESGFRLVLKARQADSKVLADEASIRVDEFAPGRTATPSADLTVPDGYNYYLDAVLWRDGVVVDTARAPANLDPEETISVNETRRDVGLEVSDFEREDGRDRADREPRETDAGGATASQPGFGLAVAALALLATLFIRRRLQ